MRGDYTFIHLLEFCLIRQYIFKPLNKPQNEKINWPFPDSKMFHKAIILSVIHISPLDLLKRNIDYVTLVLVTWVSDFILQSLLFFLSNVCDTLC